MGRSLLDLGGKHALIVAETADLKLAIPAIAFGAVGTAGQRCTSTRRIIAHASILPALTERLLRAYGQVRIGDPLDPQTLMGPLVTPEAVAQMEASIARAVADGGTVLCGGRRRPDLGPQFVEPTIIRMPSQSAVVHHETFAPILYLLEYNDFAEALALHNGVPQGLSSAIFTESMRRAEEFVSAHGSDCGIANVNIGTSGAEIGGAFEPVGPIRHALPTHDETQHIGRRRQQPQHGSNIRGNGVAPPFLPIVHAVAVRVRHHVRDGEPSHPHRLGLACR